MGRAELWSELMKLTPAERIELVEDLWDSIGPDSLPPLSAQELDELDRELAEILPVPKVGTPFVPGFSPVVDDMDGNYSAAGAAADRRGGGLVRFPVSRAVRRFCSLASRNN
jgi:putative addiction module component (TIGR02574 family)